MGEVYRAKDTRLDRTVAIKVSPSHLSSDPELKQRMEREDRAISALQHTIFRPSRYWRAGSDRLPGHGISQRPRLSLTASRKARYRSINPEKSERKSAWPDKAHQQGIVVDRDLKPANIMLHQRRRQVDGLRTGETGDHGGSDRRHWPLHSFDARP